MAWERDLIAPPLFSYTTCQLICFNVFKLPVSIPILQPQITQKEEQERKAKEEKEAKEREEKEKKEAERAARTAKGKVSS